MSPRRMALASVAAASVAGSACATGDAFRAPGEESALERGEVEILVRNANFNQVTIYAVRNGAQRRLGIVAGKSEATFRTKWRYADMQLRVRFLAGPDYLTETLPASPGELLELIVPVRSQADS